MGEVVRFLRVVPSQAADPDSQHEPLRLAVCRFFSRRTRHGCSRQTLGAWQMTGGCAQSMSTAQTQHSSAAVSVLACSISLTYLVADVRCVQQHRSPRQLRSAQLSDQVNSTLLQEHQLVPMSAGDGAGGRAVRVRRANAAGRRRHLITGGSCGSVWD